MASDPEPDSMSDEDLVVFFRALSASRRKQYEQLAHLDRLHGEDVSADESPGDARGEKTASEKLS